MRKIKEVGDGAENWNATNSDTVIGQGNDELAVGI